MLNDPDLTTTKTTSKNSAVTRSTKKRKVKDRLDEKLEKLFMLQGPEPTKKSPTKYEITDDNFNSFLFKPSKKPPPSSGLIKKSSPLKKTIKKSSPSKKMSPVKKSSPRNVIDLTDDVEVKKNLKKNGPVKKVIDLTDEVKVKKTLKKTGPVKKAMDLTDEVEGKKTLKKTGPVKKTIDLTDEVEVKKTLKKTSSVKKANRDKVIDLTDDVLDLTNDNVEDTKILQEDDEKHKKAVRETNEYLSNEDLLASSHQMIYEAGKRDQIKIHNPVATHSVKTLVKNGAFEKELRREIHKQHVLFINHNNNHWSMLFIDPHENVAEYYDSLYPGEKNKDSSFPLYRSLVTVAQDVFPGMKLKVNPQRHQSTGTECGVFVLMYFKLRVIDQLSWAKTLKLLDPESGLFRDQVDADGHSICSLFRMSLFPDSLYL
jgi:hypothetical protein